MATARWKGKVIAQSDDIVEVEGNAYFPRDAVKSEHLRASTHHTVCGWKGDCSYFDVVVDGEVNENAAWYYESPKPAAANIRGRVAFWHGVTVER